ncbi:polymeric immunoglobulin receptor-like [Hemiscyllium ocellatum]|uniref:polymeric immunoglobulin receptor-like n=1 Tax=Hemiscyllium ocellatum TaxID=170820 RepID=UPI0029662978|nr:polymeric immunoglobulin receptor-like [Hemiscyllium ocellatum]
MGILILFICSIPVSGALWAETLATGILGRTITIACNYNSRWYQPSMKYWCHGWTRDCKVIATTNWQTGRISITDNKTQGIFLVTMKNLQWGDAGWYSCGIDTPGLDPHFNVKLHISEEAVSVPGLRFLSQPNVSCSGGSVTVSCESARGSLPIHYAWSEKMPSQDSKISDTNKLDLHCQSFTQQHHQYYCTASNTQGTKPSEMVNVSVNNVRQKNCSYRIQINSIGEEYFCDNSSTISAKTSRTTRTSSESKSVTKSYVVWDVIRWVLFTVLVICSVSVTIAERLTSRTELIFVNKTMWTLILLICSIPVSGALWAEKGVTGILGRAITISCHYEARWYQSHKKYWCLGWTRLCKVIATTNWPNGRISITDNKTQGIFLVTITNLQQGDAGWYSCGIETFGHDPMFNVKLHISDEAVSVPGLRFLSQPNVSCSGGSVTISCDSARGSLPIHYTWSEKMPSQDSKISDTNKLDLHCQSFTQQHHQYYCTASNTQGTKSSEIVHVSVNNVREKNCSYRIQINSIRSEYTCDKSSTISSTTSTTISSTLTTISLTTSTISSSTSTTISPTTSPTISSTTSPTISSTNTPTISSTTTGISSGPKSVSKSYIAWDVIRWVLFTLLVICSVSVTMFTQKHEIKLEDISG